MEMCWDGECEDPAATLLTDSPVAAVSMPPAETHQIRAEVHPVATVYALNPDIDQCHAKPPAIGGFPVRSLPCCVHAVHTVSI